MEYLMTYGWAILIVIIVAAALYALGIFDPSTWTGPRATGFTGIGMPATGAWQVNTNPTDNFQVNLANNLPSRINITNATTVYIGTTLCSNVKVDDNVLDTVLAQPVGIGNSFTLKATCLGMTQGSSYTADVTVVYDNLDTGMDAFRETGTLTGKVS